MRPEGTVSKLRRSLPPAIWEVRPLTGAGGGVCRLVRLRCGRLVAFGCGTSIFVGLWRSIEREGRHHLAICHSGSFQEGRCDGLEARSTPSDGLLADLASVFDEPSAHRLIERLSGRQRRSGHMAAEAATVQMGELSRPAIQAIKDVGAEDDRAATVLGLLSEKFQQGGP